jgi:hypothetical protein
VLGPAPQSYEAPVQKKPYRSPYDVNIEGVNHDAAVTAHVDNRGWRSQLPDPKSGRRIEVRTVMIASEPKALDRRQPADLLNH